MLDGVIDNIAEPGDPKGKVKAAGQEIQRTDFQIEITFAGSQFCKVQAVMPGTCISNKSPHFGVKPESETWVGDGLVRMIAKADAQAVAAAREGLRLPVEAQKLYTGIANFARPGA